MARWRRRRFFRASPESMKASASGTSSMCSSAPNTDAMRRAGHDATEHVRACCTIWRKSKFNRWSYQLLDQGLLDRTPGDRPILKLKDASWAGVCKGEREVKLLKPKEKAEPIERRRRIVGRRGSRFVRSFARRGAKASRASMACRPM